MKSYSIIKISRGDYDYGFRIVLAKHSIDLMHTLDFILPTQTVRLSSVESIKATGKCRVTDRIVGLEDPGALNLPPWPQHLIFPADSYVSESTGHTTWSPCPQEV